MTILVTGGAGFIGSHFVDLCVQDPCFERIIVLDALTYAGSVSHLKAALTTEKVQFIHGDVCDRALLDQLFLEHAIDQVVHFAAESHVDRSIVDSAAFVRTNVVGTQVLLDAAKSAWWEAGGFREESRFLMISTDEVYGTADGKAPFVEAAPLEPQNPYAASKAAAELLVRAYCNTYEFPALITRSCNTYGPRQHLEKLIPRMIQNAIEGLPLPVYGDGLQRREWLYVTDHCEALLLVLQRGRLGECYNVGSGDERVNLEVVRALLQLVGKSDDLIAFVDDRPGHDRRYALNAEKLRRELGWTPKTTFEAGLKATVASNQDGTSCV